MSSKWAISCHEQKVLKIIFKINLKINGAWSNWTSWTQCTLSCLTDNDIESVRQKSRRCDSPAPSLGGRYCSGTDRKTEICNVPYCAIDGNWSTWTTWSACSASCGNGTKVRYRKCDNPPAQYGGSYCEGQNLEISECYLGSCAGMYIITM